MGNAPSDLVLTCTTQHSGRYRKSHFGPKPWRIVQQIDFCTVQFHNRGDKAQPQTAAIRRPRPFKSVETAEDIFTLLLGNAGTCVGDVHDKSARFRCQMDRNLSARRTMTDGILDEIGEKLHEKLAIAANVRRTRATRRICEPVAGIFGHNVVDIADVGQRLRQIDRDEAGFASAGLDLRDP